MNLTQLTETFGGQSHKWLGSARGTESPQSCTMKVSAFTAGTHYPSLYVPDGTKLAVPTSGSNAGYAVPLAARVTEVQNVAITGTPTGGTFTLTLDGETTAAIAYNAIASAVQTALEGLSNVSVGDVAVTGGPGPATPYVVTFGTGTKWAGKNVPQMTGSAASLTGGTPVLTVTTTTGGGSGVTDGSDILAGFLLYPQSMTSAMTVVVGPLLDTGRIINAQLPIPCSQAEQDTNPRFVFV